MKGLLLETVQIFQIPRGSKSLMYLLQTFKFKFLPFYCSLFLAVIRVQVSGKQGFFFEVLLMPSCE